MKNQINPNGSFTNYIQALLVSNNVEIRPLQEGRSKVIGFMGKSGEYEVDGLLVNDYAHYGAIDEPRRWSLKAVNGCYSFTFAEDEDGKVWFAPIPFLDIQKDGVEWQPTTITLDK